MAIEWQKQFADLPIYCAYVAFSYEPSHGPDTTKTAKVLLRIEGRDGTFRVDKDDFPGIWVAIDGGTGFETREEAMAYAERWVGAAKEQGTTDPYTNNIQR